MSIVSVACYAENEEIKQAILKSDSIRWRTLDASKAIPGYDDLPPDAKTRLYDEIQRGL